ncbi:hypothetical protein GLAREA_08558 [Glarea lozoyensis ATCC 20868]|uniref:Uncharacterized protein n=1 Tax=Glarea lozoyensis (strain ATCC 20868 / MF5171) TaxID=1116229 RepID=S3CFI6_GLAL2|nr:uncharacterized protein GLAREA_08558 [Glarea lozoyensis ATCC 20868]EPE24705.1 hypothetical protein GLAREA_08558 [Glarea lozoyensis ATCC 20868]
MPSNRSSAPKCSRRHPRQDDKQKSQDMALHIFIPGGGQGGSGIPQARPSGSVHAKEISEIQTSFVNNNHTSPTSSASFTSINNNRVATTTLPPTPRAPSIETPTCETSTATSVDWIPPVVFHYALPWQTSMPLQNARNLKHSRVLALYGVCPHLMPPSKATVISSRCRR